VQRYSGQPFAVLGINLDADRQAIIQAQAGTEWPSLWDGPDHHLASSWNVRALPGVFLIDRRGVIRFASEGTPTAEVLQRKIAVLLQEHE
jgi:hypothetical protein